MAASKVADLAATTDDESSSTYDLLLTRLLQSETCVAASEALKKAVYVTFMATSIPAAAAAAASKSFAVPGALAATTDLAAAATAASVATTAVEMDAESRLKLQQLPPPPPSHVWENLAKAVAWGASNGEPKVTQAALDVLSYAACSCKPHGPRMVLEPRYHYHRQHQQRQQHRHCCRPKQQASEDAKQQGAEACEVEVRIRNSDDKLQGTCNATAAPVRSSPPPSCFVSSGPPAGSAAHRRGTCHCLMCSVARAVLHDSRDPWVIALPAEALAQLAATLHAVITAPATFGCREPQPATVTVEAAAAAGQKGETIQQRTAQGLDPHAMGAKPLPGAASGGVGAWVEATGGQPLLALFRLYSLASRSHSHSHDDQHMVPRSNSHPKEPRQQQQNKQQQPAGSMEGTSPGGLRHVAGQEVEPCCLAAKLLLAAVAEVCRTAPGAVRQELAGAGAAAAADSAAASSAIATVGKAPPAAAASEEGAERLVRGLVSEVRRLLQQCPRGLLPRLGKDGRISSYDPNGITAADPCRTSSSSPSVAYLLPSSTATTGVKPAVASTDLQRREAHEAWFSEPLVVVALRALSSLCGCSKRGARMAYAAGGLDLLEEAGRRVTHGSGSPPPPLEVEMEALYVALAARCHAALDDICTGSDVRGLVSLVTCASPGVSAAVPSISAATVTAAAASTAAVAMAVPGLPLSVRVRAVGRLCALVDSCDPDDFALLCRGSPVAAVAATASGVAGGSGDDGVGGGGVGGAGSGGVRQMTTAAPLAVAWQWMGGCTGKLAAAHYTTAGPVASVAGREGALPGTGDDERGGSGGGGEVGPEAVSTGARLLLSCLERARRTAWIQEPIRASATSAQTGCDKGRPPIVRHQGYRGAVRFAPGLRGSFWEELVSAAAGAGGAADELVRVEMAAQEAERTGRRADMATYSLSSAPPLAPAPPSALQEERASAPGAADPAGRPPTMQASPLPPPEQKQQQQRKQQPQPQLEAQQRKQELHGSGSRDSECCEYEYDEDGLRTVWNSGPKPAVAAARAAWAAVPLRERVSWSQTSSDVYVNIQLPPGTRRAELSVAIAPQRLTVRLGWCGRVVDGPLHRKVAAAECVWTLEGDSLQVLLVKADRGHYWRALFEGGEEKGLYQVLQEAVDADEPVVPVDQMDEGGRLLLEELLERQAMIADGSFDLERSFDDFRVVVGDSTL